MSELGSVIEFTTDLGDAEAPRALPAGDYPVTISGAELMTSKSSGKPMVKVDFRISPDDFPADYEDAESFADGKTVSMYLSIANEKAAMFRMRRFVENIGAPMGKSLNVNDWVGRKAMATISAEEFEGVERERLGKIDAL